MKNIIFFFIILSLSCAVRNKKNLDIPWYVKERIKKDRLSNYNYRDSLEKYNAYHKKEIENLGNYYSYLSNLNFIENPSNKKDALQFLNKAFELDSLSFCNNLIAESYQYLKPNGRPYRRYTMPFILDLDLDYFISCLKECQAINNQPEFDFNEEQELMLHLHYILLKDQWFRIPSKKANPKRQQQFDRENRKALDELFEQFDFPVDNEDLKENIFTLLLHSTDCEWTGKWLGIYMEKYRGYEKYEKHLKHFLWRSSCSNPELEKLIQEELKINTP